jgi:carboxypeptidase PM20D1
MKYFFYTLLLALVGLLGYMQYRTVFLSPSLQPEARNVSASETPKNALLHLQQAVRCATNSYQNHIDTAAFAQLKTLIDTTFQLCNSRLERRVVNQFSFLYKWKGKDTSLAPVILLAHLDVVPVEGASRSAWTHDPYGGELAQSVLWGRGSLDDKMSAFSILEAAETLLQQGFQPERTFYFAFGHDEEVGGENGAQSIAMILEKEDVKAEAVLDEGMVVLNNALPGLKPPLALIGIAEKGYTSLEFSVSEKGGHSSMPPDETSIGILSKAIVALQDHPMAARMSLPVNQLLDYAAPEMDFPFSTIMTNRWLTEPLLKYQFLKKASTAALLRTTTAPTMFNAGVKDNVLAREAKATVNFRILQGETADEVLKYTQKTINDARVKVKIVGHVNEPSPISDINAPAFKSLSAIIRGSFKGTVVSPALVLGGTDSRHYSKLTKNVLRFTPIVVENSDLSRIHGVDECISTHNYLGMIRFYSALLKDGWQ